MAENQEIKKSIPNKKSTGREATGPGVSEALKKSLGMFDVIALIVGIVVGAGIFRTPSVVALNSESTFTFLGSWVLGGVISLIGALCYAELTTAYPNTGGDYYFLFRAYGRRIAFLFAWARMCIIQTGSIAILAFIFGDYMGQFYSLGNYSTEIYAAVVVIILTGINILGVNYGAGTQKLLTTTEIAGILIIIGTGLFFVSDAAIPEAVPPTAGHPSFGLAMVFVLLTFGGWNEAAYISAELKSGEKKMATALVVGIITITIIYLLVNFSFLKILGLSQMAESDAIAVDFMDRTLGTGGAWMIGMLVAIAAVTSANATIFTGARSNYALGKDFKIFSLLGKWRTQPSGPINALLIQGFISLILISLGLLSREGFETIVEYTAPVFWFFFLMVGIAIFILRHKEPDIHRPFKIPFYPITPILFCGSSAYLLYSSINYTGWGALVGIGVLLVGAVFLFFID